MVAPLVVIIFMFILGGVSYVSLIIQKSATEDIFNHNFKNYQTTATVGKDLASVHANVYKAISWANANYDAKKIEQLGKEQLSALDRSVEAIATALKKKDNIKEEADLLQSVSNSLAEYKKAAYSAIDLSGSDLNMATMYMNTADNKFQILYKNLHELLELQNKLSQDRYDFSLKSFHSALIIFIIMVALAIGVSLLVSIAISNLVTAPIEKTIIVTEKIAEGDLTQKIDLYSNDEIGKLVSAIRTMGERLKSVLSETKSTADNVASAGQELSASSEQMSQGVADQSGKASQIASASEKMSQTIVNVAANSSTMAASAIETAKVAKQGKEIVSKSVDEVKAIATTVNKSAQLMSSLGERSRQIGNIVKVIKDISDQTNLLALNAAIEAARAGEQGRGFAVVADEVRKLAERTTTATSEIGAMIGSIQQEVEEAIDNMNEGTKRVEIGVEFASKAGDALHIIVNSVEDLQSIVQQIASSTEEMSTVSEQISGDIGMIASVTEDTSASSEHIAQSASNLAKLSSDLQSLVGQFKL